MNRPLRLGMALTLVVARSFAEETANSEVRPARYVFEASGTFGLTASPSARGDKNFASNRTIGVMGSLGLTFRSEFFLAPFLELGYGALRSADYRIQESNGTTTLGTASLSAISFTLGPSLDLWRFRLRAGVGMHSVLLSTDLYEASHTSEWSMSYLFGTQFKILQTDRWSLIADLRIVPVVESGYFYSSLGVGGRYDFARIF